jgi:transcriptional regulator with XRE-family HTH domain
MVSDEPPAFDGSGLRDIRESRGLSCQQFAAATVPPLSRTYIHLLEDDRRSASNPRRPSLDVLWRLERALDVTPTAFASPGGAIQSAPRRKLPAALAEAIARFDIAEADVVELSYFSFRGRQLRSARDWAQLLLAMLGAIGAELPE